MRTIILIMSILFIITSCRVTYQPFIIKDNFYVSTITKTGNKCIKEKCNISIANNKVILESPQHNIEIGSFGFVHYGDAYGSDKNGKEWEVMVGTSEKEPYLLLLKTDSVAILIGTQCY